MNADQQRWDPDCYRRWAAYVPALGRDVMGLLDPRPGERVLDLGCGDGTLTAHMAACGCNVLGVDRDAGFVKATRQRGLSAVQADARHLLGLKLWAGSFDAVFSNAVLHWIPEAAAVIANVRRLLRDGGRFVGELGGAGNIATVRQALHQALHCHGIDAASRDSWFFPTADGYRHLLEDHGFQVTEIRLFPRPTPLPGPLSQWLDTFAATFLDGLDPATRQAVVDEVSKRTASRLCNADGLWTVDYVRLRFRAVKLG
ncbi:MAG: methyltransferase domain-containing protein [Synechococcus sp. SB0666_bin_14]|nr:methyltransferase domain-containing protein [Synechococcus sp. SB0666_bin_14]MYA91529.1 methyltransferase domain-containing protein [Synechococcus sp. SB0663_bin_10]MYG46236.1 methyltransferase domain-containing protein [Synechococcus sp. SB0675_bin_6]MYJ59957.1 methyltransferase domain-containing protein [Synechococcus sp. SB0672_bin_6]MYK92072.1 methyltransferase domain-containing protein [Synechococcus sp. SB0669_bin_8]